MLRIKHAFENKAKIAYLTAGDGGMTRSVESFLALVNGGANLLEVGIPYSDPVADGPVIQAAMERSLKAGTTVASSLAIINQIRMQSDVAIIAFTYFNPICNDLLGFLTKLKQAGADGVLIVDLPYEEAADFYFYCKNLELSPITVVSPSTKLERMQKILTKLDNGFIYYACQKGTTGTRDGLPSDLSDQLANIKHGTNLPIAGGFGVSNNQMVREILAKSDGCVVGSYLVKQLEKLNITSEELTGITQDLFATN